MTIAKRQRQRPVLTHRPFSWAIGIAGYGVLRQGSAGSAGCRCGRCSSHSGKAVATIGRLSQ